MIQGHGDDTFRYDDIRLNFSSNVYFGFDHRGLYSHLQSRMPTVMAYPSPDASALTQAIAESHRIDPDSVAVTNGATEAIYLIAQYARRSKSAVLNPTFSEYADACRLHEHTVCSFLSLGQLPSRADMVWLCNPNNPTGQALDKAALLECVDSNPDKTFVVDQSYAPFTLKRLITAREAAERPNLLLLYSMTKRFAIPGLRLGYAVGPSQVMSLIRGQRMPWSVNCLALEAGDYLLRHEDEYDIDITGLLDERDRVAESLRRLGCVDVWPSDTHILLCRLRSGKAAALKDYLAREWGILIRDASNFEGLDSSFFRIAVQSRDNDDELLDAITDFIFNA